MRPDEIVLTADEVVIVRGWYGGLSLTAMAGKIGVTRQAVALRIRHMRRRGIALTERANSWRATRAKSAAQPQETGGAA